MQIITSHELSKISVLKIIIYLRKSRAEGKESVEEVLARHERILQEYAVQTFGEPIPEHNIYREVVSGETIKERDKIKEVFSRIEKEDIEVLLVIEPQRISRGDMIDCGTVVQTLKYTETLVATITKTYDLNNKFDKEIFESQLLQGNKYLEYQKEIMGRGKLLSFREGKYLGGRIPFGYRKTPLIKGFKLEKDPETSETVELIFSLFLNERMSVGKITKYLNASGIPGPTYGKYQWRKETVRRILQNEVYYGGLAWGKAITVKKWIDGEVNKMKEYKRDYQVVRGLHEAYVSKEDWDMVQSLLQQQSSFRLSKGREARNPFAGLLYCSRCGCVISRHTYSKTKYNARKLVRVHKIDKVAINSLLREAKIKSDLSFSKISKILNISQTVVFQWFRKMEGGKVHYGDSFSKSWLKLKEILNITTDEFDESILTYDKPKPPQNRLICSNENCDMPTTGFESLEEKVLEDLKNELKDFKYYVDNYEVEIIKTKNNNMKMINQLNKKLKDLQEEKKNLLRARNREEYSYEEFIELKIDIEDEISNINQELEELENTEENDHLEKCKKAIPKLEDCLENYHTMSIPQKNEALKSIIERIEYNCEEREKSNPRITNKVELTTYLKI